MRSKRSSSLMGSSHEHWRRFDQRKQHRGAELPELQRREGPAAEAHGRRHQRCRCAAGAALIPPSGVTEGPRTEMTLLLKDPDAVLDYAIDWGAQYLDEGDLIADSTWSVEPDE